MASALQFLFEEKPRECGGKYEDFAGFSRGDEIFVTLWRRERDSNPRYPLGYNGFQDRRFQPLTHPSAERCDLSLSVLHPVIG